MFGCAWKINFPENIFSWLCFSSFDLEIVFSQNFHFKPFPNSCRERERESPNHAFDFADLRTHEPIIDPEPLTHKPSTSPATQSLCAMNPQTDLSLCDFDFLLSLISEFFYCCCGGVGGGVLVVFLLCGGGFCVGGGGK